MNTVRARKKGQQYKLYVNDIYIGPVFKGDFEKVGMSVPDSEDYVITFDTDREVTELNDIIYERAYQKAIGYLATAEYSAGIIRNKLYMKGYSEEVVDIVIEILYESNYLDDGRFVEAYTRSYIKTKSRALIEREICDRGVDATKYRDVMDNVYSDEGITDEDVINNLLAKKYDKDSFGDMKVKRRAISYLSRHGFTYDMINNYLT